MERIPLSRCINRGIYKISSRNLISGVFNSKSSGFIGIRQKFNHVYLFTEYHWDYHPTFGTVSRMEYLGIQLPDNIELIEQFVYSKDGSNFMKMNQELFNFLEEINKEIDPNIEWP